MSKTTYAQRFEKVSKFYDNAYHHHKATYKGFSQFFKAYCTIQKDYSNQILKLSEGVNGFITDFTTELPYIQQGIKEVCSNLERISQLHFNYGQRLREIGDFCKEEYNVSKRNKERFMKLNFEKNEEEHEKVKESKNRNMLNEKEKQICKRLYNTIDQFMEDESARTQKLKEQLIIYFSLTKKIAEKELELAGAYNIKMAQFQIQVKVPLIYEIEDMLVDQFNCYGEEKMEKKMRDINQQISVHRSSLRDSIIKKEKNIKIEDFQSKMQEIMERFNEVPEELNYPNEEELQIGLFDKTVFPNYKAYSRQFRSDIVKQLSYAFLSSFYIDGDDQTKSFLLVMKTNLKLRSINAQKIKDTQNFIEIFSGRTEYKWTLLFLTQLSQVYYGKISIQEFNSLFKNRKELEADKKKGLKQLHWKVCIVIVDTLLESIIIVRQGFSLLYEEYIDIVKLIINFAKKMFNIDASLTILLLLKKLQRALSITNSQDEQIIEQLYQNKLEVGEDDLSQTEGLKIEIGHKIINFLTDKMSRFYSCKIAFSNLAKLSLCLQKYLPKNYFTSIDHMHKCIKIAGFNFFIEMDEDKKVTQGGVWRGEERLKNLTEILQQIQYGQIKENYFQPISKDMCKLIGVGSQVILSKMLKEFLTPMSEIINCNLSILSQQEGVDRQGYVLRLGLCLAALDLQQPQKIAYYDCYFQVLEAYLTSTEKDYDSLLEHSRKTELWIVEQNSQATQNCIDFCSMLYKPFEFLLTSLKKLEQGKVQTQFTIKYDQFIKLKLNNALKSQIQKYVKFLIQSLTSYNSKQPQLSLKPKRYAQILAVSNDDITKQRYSFREITRRVYNIIFLKDQLDQIVSDFIEKEVYQSIELSIFNLELLAKVLSKSKQQHLLTNIYQIATLISSTQAKLVSLVASITVYHFLRRLFTNLYFQEERGFFSGGDYKLSEYTFQKSQKDIEEILMTMSKNIPAESIDAYSKEVCSNFFKSFKLQALNVHKFKISISQQAIINYLKGDLAFACNLLKKKFFDSAFVRQCIEQPAKQFFKDMEKPAQKLMECFSESSLKNNNEQAKYYLALINIKKDEKGDEFVQKYKKVLK